VDEGGAVKKEGGIPRLSGDPNQLLRKKVGFEQAETKNMRTVGKKDSRCGGGFKWAWERERL